MIAKISSIIILLIVDKTMDDLHDKNKAIKEAVCKMTLAGDYVKYANIKKGLYIDFSDQCHGLQMADICAGVFTASLKYLRAQDCNKRKFQMGSSLFFNYTYKNVRHISITTPYTEVYGYGVKEIPKGAGRNIAVDLSSKVEQLLERDTMQELQKLLE